MRVRPEIFHPTIGSYGFPSQVQGRDGSCVVTGSGLALNAAHLVPVAYSEWFERNNMLKFIQGNDIHDYRNGITLRKDVHAIFDALDICFVPKNSHWTCHVSSSRPGQELVDLYHNLCVRIFQDVCLEFLFARFAMTVFRHSYFMKLSRPGKVSLVYADNYGTLETQEADSDWIKSRQVFLGLRSRSSTPSKRTRTESQNDEDGEEVLGRGRKRTRWESESAGSGHITAWIGRVENHPPNVCTIVE